MLPHLLQRLGGLGFQSDHTRSHRAAINLFLLKKIEQGLGKAVFAITKIRAKSAAMVMWNKHK
jgi:hypothetical protein